MNLGVLKTVVNIAKVAETTHSPTVVLRSIQQCKKTENQTGYTAHLS